MKRVLIRFDIVIFMFMFFVLPLVSQQVTTSITTDPQKALFIYTDIENFIRAHQLMKPGTDKIEILKNHYLKPGTPGLQMFVQKYDLYAERLAKAIEKHPKDYAALDGMVQWLKSKEAPIRKAFSRLKQFIPDVIFPPTYYLIGAYRGIGSGSLEGQLITVEKSASKLAEKHDMTTLLVHELVHFQQAKAIGYEKYIALFNKEKSLLGLTIREGTAEYFADLVTGKMTQEEARDYTIQKERELWERFQKEMKGRETGDWMWKNPSDPQQPPHVAYVLGARIVESYYKSAKDKAKAVREILSVTDYTSFLEKSGYAKKVKK